MKDASDRVRREWRWVLFVFFTYLMMAGPGAAFANRIEPLLLGAPFFFAWSVFWQILMIIGVLVLLLRVWRDPLIDEGDGDV